MTYTQWPNWTDVKQFIASSKVAGAGSLSTVAEAIGEMDYKLALLATIESFKRASGWYPFLGAQGVRKFNPPGPQRDPIGIFMGLGVMGGMGGSNKLFLDSGLISVNSVTTGVSFTSAGTLQTLGRDFWLLPTDAPSQGEPYRQIQFSSAIYGNPESIVVDGVWGFALTLPDHVVAAVIRQTAADMTPLLSMALTQGRSSYKEGDEETRFVTGQTTPFHAERAAWSGFYERTLSDISRKSL